MLSETWTHPGGGGKVLKLQGDEYSHLYHCSQQGRAHAPHDAVLEQLRAMLLDAECGYGWRVERTLENPGAPVHLRTWRADRFAFALLACVSW